MLSILNKTNKILLICTIACMSMQNGLGMKDSSSSFTQRPPWIPSKNPGKSFNIYAQKKDEQPHASKKLMPSSSSSSSASPSSSSSSSSDLAPSLYRPQPQPPPSVQTSFDIERLLFEDSPPSSSSSSSSFSSSSSSSSSLSLHSSPSSSTLHLHPSDSAFSSFFAKLEETPQLSSMTGKKEKKKKEKGSGG
jgi:hypothetical protein